ncbi:S-adenosyl-L-methionine-dependent methyltransferase [Thozetella sp. PMI_491]|nr:S-adenosyl-L-methionine-dependent methyltransferase [Thozetella sp. PMI_491]
MTSSVYGLNVGDIPEEQRRLEWQHWNIFLPIQNGLLLPSKISDYVQSVTRPAVADVGTGTGVWLKTLADQLPLDARLHGFDFDTSKFPKPELLLPNIQLQYADALKPFREELIGQYDLVHVRAFVFALRGDDEWERIVAHLMSLLKPGGWLLWDETSMSSWVTVPLGDAWSKVIRLTVNTSVANGVNPCAPYRLMEYLKKAGLVECDEVIKNTLSRAVSREAANQFAVDGLRQYVLGLLRKGGEEGVRSKNDVDALFGALEKELREESELSLNLSQTWGRKTKATSQ